MIVFPGTARSYPYLNAAQASQPPSEPDQPDQTPASDDGQDYGDIALSLPLPDSGPGEVR
ncbi:hypothetical protein [Streptomyces sp. NPDC037389]|uniref:hypothetical protein n=1 Tax=Streptomyces sp. NPDC037389 TaxID=3155369 RepID=UPI0033D24097